MIKFLNNWIEVIAIAVIIVSILEMILPNGNIKRYIKVILGIYVIFAIISPFVDSKALYSLKLEDEIDKYSQNFEQTNNIGGKKEITEDTNKIYKNTLEKQIAQTVEAQGYNVYKCSVEGNFYSEDKDIGIKKIQIILDSKKILEDNENLENKTSEENNILKIEEIEKVEINSKVQEKRSEKITNKDIEELKKYLSQHYEIEKNIFEIKAR